MKVIIDDTCLTVETPDREINLKSKGDYNFYKAIRVLLTPEQYDKFWMQDTARIFSVSVKKFKAFEEFLAS